MVIYALKGGYFMSEEMLMIGNVAGMILQSILCGYFILTVKGLKTKRVLFITTVTLEYLFLKTIINLNYTVNFELMFGILIYCVLKLIYKDKCKITDLVTYVLSLIYLGIFSVPGLLVFGANILTIFISTILAILTVYLLRHKLNKIDVFYNKFWNRHQNNKMLKSVTIRGFSVTITIITFVLLHFWLIYGIYAIRR